MLQQPQEIKMGDKVLTVAPPSVATLILASAAISKLPDEPLNEEKVAEDSLAAAKFCKPLGEIAAILILGAKASEDMVPVVERQRKSLLWGLVKLTMKKTVPRKKKDVLADELLNACSPRELNSIISELMSSLQLGDFFGLTTFLIGINILRPTKKVANGTTASGQ